MAYSVSIIIPVFNEEENLNLLHEKITDAMSKMSHKYEIIVLFDLEQNNINIDSLGLYSSFLSLTSIL